MTMIFDPVMLDPQPGSRNGAPAYAVGTIGNMTYTAAQAGAEGNLISVTHALAPVTPATKASLEIAGMTYRAKNAGLAGNAISVLHSSSAIAGTAAAATIGGVSYTAISSGAAGNNISVTASLGSASVAGSAILNRGVPSLGTTWPFTITEKTGYHGTPTTVRLMGSSVSAPSSALPSSNSDDPYFTNTRLLLRAGGSSVTNNSTFLDSSPNAFNVLRTGNVQQGTFSPYALPDGYWSTYFNSLSDYVTITDNNAFTFDADFTIEAWIQPTVAAAQSIVYHWAPGTATLCSFALSLTATNALRFSYGVGALNAAVDSAASAVTLNQWNHVAVSRSGTSLKLFVNGQVVQTATVSGALNNCANPLYIGTGSTDYFTGYISNLRLVKGNAVYTGAFSVPTSPLTAISGTSLLTLQSNNIVDKSSNGFTLTTSHAKVVSVSPFSVPAYSRSVNGGSAYFDGAGDLASVSDNNLFTFTGDFTVEAWLYADLSSASAEQTIVAHWKTGVATACSFLLATTSTTGLKFGYGYGASSSNILAAAGTLRSNAWNHVAVSRSGSSIRLFANGKQVGSAVYLGSLNNCPDPLYIGQRTSSETFYMKGHISDLRIVNGSAIYTSPFSVPSAPLAAVSSTALLLKCNNAEIQDLTGTVDIETAGSAISYSTGMKYNTKSIYFNGVNSYLSLGPANNPHLNIGSSDFTIEAWVYRAAGGTASPAIYANYGGARSGGHLLRIVGATNKATFYVYPNTDVVTSTSNIPLNTWTHIAVSRSGSTTYMYINGVMEASSTVAYPALTSDSAHPATSGGYWQSVSLEPSGYFTGQIEDLRVTRGVARYKAPTAVTRELSGSTEIVSFPNGTTVNQLLAVVGTGGTNESARVSITAPPSTAALLYTDPVPATEATTSGGSAESPLSVSVTGTDISVTLPRSGATSAAVSSLLNDTASVTALVAASASAANASTASQTFLTGGADAQAGSLAASVLDNAISISVPAGTTNSALKSFLESVESVAGSSGLIDLVDPVGSAPVSSGPLSLAGGTAEIPGVFGVAVVGNDVSVSVPSGTTSADLATALNADGSFSALVTASVSDGGAAQTAGNVTLSGGA
jgi:hypothetical protein